MWKSQSSGDPNSRPGQSSFSSQHDLDYNENSAAYGGGPGRTDGNGYPSHMSPPHLDRRHEHQRYDDGDFGDFDDGGGQNRAYSGTGLGDDGRSIAATWDPQVGSSRDGSASAGRKRSFVADETSRSADRRKPRPSFTASTAETGRSVSPDGQTTDREGDSKNRDGDRDRATLQGPRRAAQACLRCRRQKLRCLGGWPCDRCAKGKHVCDFGKAAEVFPLPGRGVPGEGVPANGGTEANARLEQLESNVARLLASLAGGGGSGGPREPNLPAPSVAPSKGVDVSARQYRGNPSSLASDLWIGTNAQSGRTELQTQHMPPSVSPDDLSQHVRFGSTPNVTIISGGVMTSPSNHSSGISPNSVTGGALGGHERKRTGKGQKAEERLAAVTESNFEPPFKALPAVWDNKEQSRRSSPQPSGSASRDELSASRNYEHRFGRERDDPINTGIVDPHTAEALFEFFIEHCHAFLPIVNVALEDAFTTIQRSPPLFSAIIAVAARFYLRFTARNTSTLLPILDPGAPHKLANLAEMHLAQTLLRKQHALSDVQAILLLAAWGLQSGGKGPEAWLATGHAARVARRLGVHRSLAVAAETARTTKPGSDEWQKLEQFIPQWRTWLSWFCFDGFLSLGFGRPQSTQFETVDEEGFLQLRLSSALPRPGSHASLSLNGDVYIAGQIQLTQIGRDLINWGEILRDPARAMLDDPRQRDLVAGRDLSIGSMLKELNARLDEWSKLWVWAGSPYTLYLGSSARFARLQAEHMRLCLNSYALKSPPDADESLSVYLKKALNAAMSTIQTHYESSQTDLALAFATDYLTITLAQAAVFLIRLTKASVAIRQTVSLDASVVGHYLKMSVDLLEQGDMSETRLSTYLARTIRDISRAAGIIVPGLEPLASDIAEETASAAWAPFGQPHLGNTSTLNGCFPSDGLAQHGLQEPNGQGMPEHGQNAAEGILMPDGQGATTLDLEGFFQVDGSLDLSYLLGLPGDSANQGTAPAWSFGGAELEFGIGDFGLDQSGVQQSGA